MYIDKTQIERQIFDEDILSLLGVPVAQRIDVLGTRKSRDDDDPPPI